MSIDNNYKQDRSQLEAWLTQLQIGTPPPQLTRAAAAQLAALHPARLEQLLTTIIDQTEEGVVEEWMNTWLADEIPPVDTALPVFDFSFLDKTDPAQTKQPQAESEQPRLFEMMRIGRQQVDEQLHRLIIHFSQIPQILAGPQVAFGVRGKHDSIWETEEDGGKIFQISLPEELGIWGGEVSAFAENEQACRVEIAVYRIDEPTSSLANVAIVSAYDDVSETLYTDMGGVVEFKGIPRNKLAEITVHIGADG
jgi:hypothetical protein